MGNKEREKKLAVQWLNHGKLPRTWLSSYLMQHDISQEELAKADGLSNSTVNQLCLDTTC
ncbi:helix-turn-helix domain-containing protein [Ectobacillus funiculus]